MAEENGLVRAESEVVAPSSMLANLPPPRSSSEIVAPSEMFRDLMNLEPLPKAVSNKAPEAAVPQGYIPTQPPAPAQPAPAPAVVAAPKAAPAVRPGASVAAMPTSLAPGWGPSGPSAGAMAMAVAAQAAGARYFQPQVPGQPWMQVNQMSPYSAPGVYGGPRPPHPYVPQAATMLTSTTKLNGPPASQPMVMGTSMGSAVAPTARAQPRVATTYASAPLAPPQGGAQQVAGTAPGTATQRVHATVVAPSARPQQVVIGSQQTGPAGTQVWPMTAQPQMAHHYTQMGHPYAQGPSIITSMPGGQQVMQRPLMTVAAQGQSPMRAPSVTLPIQMSSGMPRQVQVVPGGTTLPAGYPIRTATYQPPVQGATMCQQAMPSYQHMPTGGVAGARPMMAQPGVRYVVMR